MKNIFENVSIEVIAFGSEDIITTSTGAFNSTTDQYANQTADADYDAQFR